MRKFLARAGLTAAVAGLAAAPVIAFASSDAEPAEEAVPQYVKFEPLLVPIYIDGEADGLLAVRVAVQAIDDAERDALEAIRPKLIDAYVLSLIEHARLRVDPARPIDAQRLTAVLQAATRKASGSPNARVLIVEAAARPI